MTKDIIEQFLDKGLYSAPSTRRGYRSSIKKYFRLINKDMNTYMSHTPEEIEQDLNSIYIKLDEEGISSISKKTFFNPVKQFLIANNKSLQDLDFWVLLMKRTKGAEPTSDETILNKKLLRQILSHSNTLGRALFLVLASSGRRIGEILALTIDDVDFTTSPVTLNIKKTTERNQTKTGQRTLCFISDEARDALKAWMLERDEYLKTGLHKGVTSISKPKSMNDRRIFPMRYYNANLIWQNILIRGNFVESIVVKDKYSTIDINHTRIKRKTKWERNPIHIHCLRKFFRSYLGDADLSEYLMGHGNYQTKTYRKMPHEDLAERYRNLMPNLTIMSDAPDLTHINEDLKKKEQKIKDMAKLIDVMRQRMEVLEIKYEVEKLKNGNGDGKSEP